MTKENTSINLDLQIKEFEKLKKQAQEDFNNQYGNDEQDSTYMFEDL